MSIIKDISRWILSPQTGSDLTTLSSNDMFTNQRSALSELMERRKDLSLKRSVLQNLHPAGRTFLEKFTRPCAVLFRQVASPTNEILRFLRIAGHAGLMPIILEYYGDKFVSAGNIYKRSLGKMPIYRHTGMDGRDIVEFRTVVDFNSYVGKPLSSVRCKNGTPLIDFHHKLLTKIAKLNIGKHCVDATEWFQGSGGSAHEYYEQFLTLFVRDAILFEVVLPTASEEEFARNVIAPAFASVERTYGLKPLIVELIPKNKAMRIYWDSYPKEVEPLI
ncbi:hypothetical protein A2853_00475 [Candidatus Kaiserbacteria bacterium RIFCSPHIGHO2_01_FULL_55_17]|uniref:Uncharacterized protein n=1 Tax=Candidatus Kaiserbacteria bacterium RIFCSPHIGHO2_01_FULL_55_17 TaxID=1798484 RepID=A0A1F6D8Q0_9BACT|nr:MAG: hypothetical protein A2853_00475 [Candidatus Kaiserbacteria bacterium RIFCSPHIGHO2_01_FULL_55_17]